MLPEGNTGLKKPSPISISGPPTKSFDAEKGK
jgi:hypothetical protein